jgi:hypothetical protein
MNTELKYGAKQNWEKKWLRFKQNYKHKKLEVSTITFQKRPTKVTWK